ncbi:hypothetical protein U1Q18_013388 [Sarracenia purpurea var. burkii]
MPTVLKDSSASTWESIASDDQKMFVTKKHSGATHTFNLEMKTWCGPYDLCPDPSTFFTLSLHFQTVPKLLWVLMIWGPAIFMSSCGGVLLSASAWIMGFGFGCWVGWWVLGWGVQWRGGEGISSSISRGAGEAPFLLCLVAQVGFGLRLAKARHCSFILL